ncbi:hypothetical protein BH09VER1_BH09VER1_07390 [soil metagenome]
MRLLRLPLNLRRRASALVITLALVVLMTILAIGMFTATRMEVTASKLHLDGMRAEILAQTGESVAMARIQTAISGTNRMWMTQPGRIVASPTNSLIPVTNVYELHSGLASLSDSNTVAADLNSALLRSPTNNLLIPASAFSGGNASMKVKWVYVRKDGAFETNLPPPVNTNNPVIGRFAFWVDDEAAKVNANTAWTRDSSQYPGTTNVPSSDPSRIDLSSVLADPAAMAAIASYRTNTSYFNSPQDIRSAGAGVTNAAQQAAAVITYYNHSPNLNMFGEPRIMLTTQKSNAIVNGVTNDFLDILTQDNVDPGLVSTNVSQPGADVSSTAKVDKVIRKLYDRLNRTNWPILPGTAYNSKFSGTNQPAWTVQIIADIIDYVRAKESAYEIVEPLEYNTITVANMALTSTADIAHPGGNSSLGTTRAPKFTEMGMWVSPTRSGGKYAALFQFEVYLPPGAGKMNLTACTLKIGVESPSSTTNYTQLSVPIVLGPPPTPDTDINNAYLDGASPYLQGGQVRVLTAYTTGLKDPALSTTNRPTETSLSATILGTARGRRLAAAPEYNQSDIVCTIDPTNVPYTGISSMGVADPFVSKNGADWTAYATNSFGTVNSTGSLSPLVGITPQQDTDATGSTVVTDSARVPAAKGTAGNPLGIMESVAELGQVHIGLNGQAGPGVPWRTLRLQPLKAGSGDLPDWALLDLFCVPVRTNIPSNALGYVRPNNGGTNALVGGVINLNETIFPFTDAANSPLVFRSQPLTALLTGARTNGTNAISAGALATILQNITNRALASGGGNQGRSFGVAPADTVFFSPGQIVEIAGVADKGEASEAIARDLIDLAATRSDVFTIYTIGQTVFQNSQGAIFVLAESRHQKMVEAVNPGGANTTIQPVFTKKLSP